MNEIEELLQRQSAWQRSRARLSWTEKLILAEVLRDGALAMRRRNEGDDDTDAKVVHNPAH